MNFQKLTVCCTVEIEADSEYEAKSKLYKTPFWKIIEEACPNCQVYCEPATFDITDSCSGMKV